MLTTTRNRTLYHEATSSAFHTLMAHTAARGGGWYHYSQGDLVISTSLTLDGGAP